MVQVREESRFGPCYALGELIGAVEGAPARKPGEREALRPTYGEPVPSPA